jgi:hypothetical protein
MSDWGWHWRPGGAYHQAIAAGVPPTAPSTVPASSQEEIRAAKDAAAAHEAWWRDEQNRIAERLSAVHDPIERYLLAVVSNAYGSTRPALRAHVDSPPTPRALAAWFARHAKTAPTPLTVHERGVFGAKRRTRAGWFFRDGTQRDFALPHGERGPVSVSILTDGSVRYGHAEAQGSAFSEAVLKAIADMCDLRNLIERNAVADDPTAPQHASTSQQPALTLDALIRERRSRGEEFGPQSF